MQNITKKELNFLTMTIFNTMAYINHMLNSSREVGEDDMESKLEKDLNKAYKITTKYEKISN